MNSLTNREKDALRWFVVENRKGNLSKEFTAITVGGGRTAMREYKGGVLPDFINKNVITLLVGKGWIIHQRDGSYFIHDSAYDLVDADFRISPLGVPDTIEAKRELLKLNYRVLIELENQLAAYTFGEQPPRLIIEIENRKSEIARLEAELNE